MASLTFSGVGKRYGETSVLDAIDLSIGSGEFVAFVGPSGCGKSTLLRMIAGLESVTSGEIAIDGARINEVHASRRGISMVFQNYALYPHMTVRRNMEYGLRISGMPKADVAAKVEAAAAMLQLGPLLDRRPGQLSGGQRQRVAIGRAIVREPRVFLFDEPLSNLDAGLRAATRVEIVRLKEALPGTTMIYVTHDQVEAMTMADRIVVMDGGRIAQVGSPLELYHRPATRFVANFIGTPAMNLLPGPRHPTAAQGAAEIGVRPEHLVPAQPDAALLDGVVMLVERLGEVTVAHLETPAGDVVIVKLAGSSDVSRGDRLHLAAEPGKLHRFAADGHAVR
ncbi:ABC sugar transporter, ATPase subunit [Oceanicola granulosus HTCC2516]|uniref:ABC sugar transporter, ATPase subunit n=1 Tax=Oceanicola granulosus (strain ATCC BAA-861 / DSM 15982 / KCTC 12143 / HTCC2516) TaxID=314256 RepID=Q2CEE9_OCEGH|nr:sn-glycerol-3-phosphate ABC transporter ATP-binding protein UgpC [Oceanicola granulosus]EAR51048.1 ABC sugar transporter, ATPase subunit [Oceanicola granulosus HTCC2516]